MSTSKILLLPGDGIGPEITGATCKVIDWFQSTGRTSFAISEGLIGGTSYDKHGTPLTAETIAQAKADRRGRAARITEEATSGEGADNA